MTRHSPFNYAFDNPIRFIDPDGMEPYSILGAVTFNGYVAPDENGDIMGGTGKKGEKVKKRECIPCQERTKVSNEIRKRSELKINENLARDMEKTGLALSSMDVVSSRLKINPNGHTSSFSIGFAFGFGMTFEFGTVSGGYGDEKSFHTISGNAGWGIEFGINESQITPNEAGTPFIVDNYQGIGSQWDLSLFFANSSIGGDHNGGYFNSPNRFSYQERSVGISPFTSFPTYLKGQLGIMYKISSTRLSEK